MRKEYYSEYYHVERKHWWFLVRAEIIKDRVAQISNLNKKSSILNVGAATFRSTEVLREFGEVTSLEFEKDCCEFVEKELGEEIINGSVLELPFANNSFDLVCAFDVIEHVEDDKLAVSEMLRVLKDDGHILVTVPAYNFLWSEHDDINHHYRRYTKSELNKLFKTFRLIKSSYFNTILFPLIFIARKLNNLKPSENKESDFKSFEKVGFLNPIFKFLFSLEKPILKMINLPFGVSIVSLIKK